MIATFAPPILFAVFLWWFSTGAFLWLVRRPPHQKLAVLAGLAVLACASTAGVVATAGDATPASAYWAFICGLGIWGVHEALFLMGLITGPRPRPCPQDATGLQRLKFATFTVLYHEIALALTVLAMFAITWGQPNQAAPLTFALLFVMRLSAKFNLFLGVPNLTDEFFPAHMAYLKSYLPKRPVNPLFPISVLLTLALLWALLRQAELAPAGSGEATVSILLFALAALALLEHAFMVLPLPDAALWRWAVPKPAPALPAPLDSGQSFQRRTTTDKE